MSGPLFLSSITPPLWLSALGVALCSMLLVLLVFMAGVADSDIPYLFLLFALFTPTLWWLLLGSRLSELIYQMIPQRLPGIERLLRRGMVFHTACSLSLPLCVLLWRLPTGIEIENVLSVLWLGSMLGLLVVSLRLAMLLVPLALFGLDWNTLSNPIVCGVLGAVCLLLASLVWRSLLNGNRSALLTPFGTTLDNSPVQWLLQSHLVKKITPKGLGPSGEPVFKIVGGTRQALPRAQLNLLAAAIGPEFQTVAQTYGRKASWKIYLTFVGLLLAIGVVYFIWPPFRTSSPSTILSTVLIVLIYMGTMESGYKLTALRRSRSAVLAELCLMPGMPQRAELPAALMRQVLRSKGEQLALMTVALTVILNLQYTPSLAWWIWWVCLIPLLLVVNVASVWLAWHGLHRFKLWEGTCAVGFLIANVLTIQLLSHRNRLEEAWIVFGFLWLALAIGVFWWLSRGASKYDQRELYV